MVRHVLYLTFHLLKAVVEAVVGNELIQAGVNTDDDVLMTGTISESLFDYVSMTGTISDPPFCSNHLILIIVCV